MPPVKQTAAAPAAKGILASLGKVAQDAHKEVKDAPVEIRERGLPDGIDNGIAEVVEMAVKRYPANHREAVRRNKPYWHFVAIVRSPEEFNGIATAGLRIDIEEPLYDTPTLTRKKFKDHLHHVENELKKLGKDPAGCTLEQVEGLMAECVSEGLLTYFRTWKGSATKQYPNPKTRAETLGLCESMDAGPADANQVPADVVETAPDEVPADEPPPADELPAEVGDATQAADAGEPIDVDALAAAADAQDRDSILALKAMAMELGIDEPTIDGVANWVEVAEMVKAIQAGGEAPAAEVPTEPEKGQVWFWQPIDKNGNMIISPATRKPVAAIQVSIVSVAKAKKTASIASLDGKVKLPAVPWDKLMATA